MLECLKTKKVKLGSRSKSDPAGSNGGSVVALIVVKRLGLLNVKVEWVSVEYHRKTPPWG